MSFITPGPAYRNITQPILESYKDENGNYHNDNGPAIITETEVYFVTHEEEWENPKYEAYIYKIAKELFPDEDLTHHSFDQIESIVLTSKGWGNRQKLHNPIIIMMDEEWSNLTKPHEDTELSKETKTRIKNLTKWMKENLNPS